MLDAAQWEDVEWVLERCESVHVPHDFGVAVVNAVRRVLPYDQARVFFLDDKGEVFDQYLIGVSQRVIEAYHGRYAHTDGELYDAERKARDYAQRVASGEARPYEPLLMDWEDEPHGTAFYREHLAGQHLRWCTGFGLFDMRGRVRVIFSLDRLASSSCPTASELEALGTAVRHLDAMYRNFYVDAPMGHTSAIALAQSDLALTKREVEVAHLLLDGLSAKGVAHALGISTATVYKHISNMHAKLGVSNQAALLRALREAASVRGA